MRLLIILTILAFSLLGCASAGKGQQPNNAAAAAEVNVVENPYANSYNARKIPEVALQPDSTGPHIYRGGDETGDYQRMLENGFDILGYSKFEAADVPPEKLNEQAKLIKADLVLVYTRLIGNTPVSVTLNKLREQSKMTGEEKRLAGNGKLLPQEQALYEYFATYWVRLAPPLIGVHIKGQSEDQGAKGLTVLAVVKKSPADKATIVKDDVLLRIGEIAMLQPEALTEAAQRYAGKTVNVVLHRGENDLTVAMTLNPKH
jgi:hypothetical protein